jgi:hypothetical protein
VDELTAEQRIAFEFAISAANADLMKGRREW